MPEKRKRKALIVMATGTGKTRTTMGLIDVFMRSNQARRILFVADSILMELVKCYQLMFMRGKSYE